MPGKCLSSGSNILRTGIALIPANFLNTNVSRHNDESVFGSGSHIGVDAVNAPLEYEFICGLLTGIK